MKRWAFNYSREAIHTGGDSLFGPVVYRWLRRNADGAGHDLVMFSTEPTTARGRALIRRQLRDAVAIGYRDPGHWLDVS